MEFSMGNFQANEVGIPEGNLFLQVDISIYHDIPILF